MSVSLSKGGSINLSKESGVGGLSKVFMGLGWDPVKSGGFFGFGGGGDIDLDASCLMFDSSQQLVDTVWFRQLKSKDGSVKHSGDNLTGEGDGDDEVINVDLQKLPSNISTLVFTITSFRGQTFDKVESAKCRLVDASSNKELASYTLSDKSKVTAQVMAKVYKQNNEWHMQAIGAPTNGSVQSDLLNVVRQYL